MLNHYWWVWMPLIGTIIHHYLMWALLSLRGHVGTFHRTSEVGRIPWFHTAHWAILTGWWFHFKRFCSRTWGWWSDWLISLAWGIILKQITLGCEQHCTFASCRPISVDDRVLFYHRCSAMTSIHIIHQSCIFLYQDVIMAFYGSFDNQDWLDVPTLYHPRFLSVSVRFTCITHYTYVNLHIEIYIPVNAHSCTHGRCI